MSVEGLSASASSTCAVDEGPEREVVAFPTEFRWGVATSAYQIEGATDVDGRSPSIWDTFCRRPGAISDRSSGAVACDHYHRWADDIALLGELGVGTYRFSIAWPRIVPGGTGPVNQAGLDFYERLVDGLLEAGITPYPTLYHWDLPQVLEDRGGWTDRVTAEAFADYASAVVDRLGDRVREWMTINEPYCAAHLAYGEGHHAPGRSDLGAALAASHHLLLGHGLAARRIRDRIPSAEVGIVLNFTPRLPDTDSDADRRAARIRNLFENRWYSDALAGLGYPAEAVEAAAWPGDEVLAGDLDLIAEPIDALGVNYYTRGFISADPDRRPSSRGPVTDMGWEIHPPTLADLLGDLHKRYRFSSYLITENGCAMADSERDDDGRIDDTDRIAYLDGHLREIHRARAAGVPVDGYLLWSFLDNFEWAFGYEKRFGIVEVDPATMDRRRKASADWYAEVMRSGVLPPTQTREGTP